MHRFAFGLALLVAPTGAIAQQPDSVPHADGYAIHWWQPVVVLAGIGAITALDQPMQRFSQNHRSSGSDDVASVFRRFGQPEVFATVSLGVLGAGLVTHDRGVTRTGSRLVAAVLLAGGATLGGKLVLGRERPNVSPGDAFDFRPFSANASMPSGHTSEAFAIATVLSDDLHNTAATIGLYTLATGTAWSRLNDDQHWLSDIALGAAVGIASAKLVSGRWRVFHLRPPHFLVSSQGLTIYGHASF